MTVGNGYAKYVNNLKKLYPYSGFSSEMEFAQELFNKPLPERMSNLKQIIFNNDSLSDKDFRKAYSCIRRLEHGIGRRI